ncbi:MAG: hypothetical protein DRI86_14660 [Bacteroidetes bacterium]|nr:MAG: hypothetical protein DRI86_14660 [Bacteroidota bacterium]
MQLTDMEYWNLVKRNFGIPYTFFELSYEDVISHLKEYSMRFMSQYVPHRVWVPLVIEDHYDPTTGLVTIPYDGEILSVVEVASSNSDIVAGYPINPIISDAASAIQYVSDVTMAKPNIALSSAIAYTFEFVEPNQLRIYPIQNVTMATIELTVKHKSISTIPARFGRDFIDYAIADLKDNLGVIRSKYSEYTTPFGVINLNSDILKNEAETTKSRIQEKFQTFPPNKLVSL